MCNTEILYVQLTYHLIVEGMCENILTLRSILEYV